MLLGIGTDIIEISRIREFAERGERYLERVFTPDELKLARSAGDGDAFLAGRFAAKEAVAKCLGPPFAWHEVEVTRGDDGEPQVILKGRAQEATRGGTVKLSISHCRAYATAVAVLEEVSESSQR